MTVSDTFRALHQGPRILLLPNAWDAGSARMIESLGAKAIATTSSGVAWAHGYRDGDQLPTECLLATTREIARIVEVPLSMDMEGGYSQDPAKVGQLALDLAQAGVAGINIEDGTASADLTCAKISAIRQSLSQARRDLFINVRTDVYLRALATGAAAVREVISRAERYRAAGCDGIFVPGLADEAAIKAIVAAIAPMPLNLMLVPGLPPMGTLRSLGVRRLSAGSAIAQAALAHTRRLAMGFLDENVDELLRETLSYGTINQLFPDG